jgi:hypothetical protein
LAPIQLAFSFIGVEVDEAGRVDIAEEDTADYCARSWEDIRIP